MTTSTSMTLPPSVLAMLNGTSAANSAGASGTIGSSGGAGSGPGGLGELDFLNLMMTQLKNQNPTSPMDESAIMGQLAQFGTVSGITQLNSSFQALSSQLTSNQALQASSLLGRNVLVAGGSAPLGAGGTLHGAVNVPAGASNVNVQIVDSSGQVVRTLVLGNPGTGLANFSWDGKTDAGVAAATGTYALVASGSVAGAGHQLGTFVQAQVTSITLNGSGGGLTLQLAGIGPVPFSAVQQIN